jgi:hypothetical protein
MRWKTWFVCLLACVATWNCYARAASQIDDPALSARINGEPVYAFTVKAMLRAAPEQPRPTAAAVLDGIIANRLLARWARGQFGAQLHDAGRVGFSREVAIDDQVVAIVRGIHGKQIEAELHALPGGTLAGLIAETYPLDTATMERVFGGRRTMRLEYTLDARLSARAAEIKLLKTAPLGGQAVSVSLNDVFRRQNVQGRMEFFSGNLEFVRKQARARVGNLFILDWARRHIGENALADLRRAVTDAADVAAAMGLYGIGVDAEAGSSLQARLAEQVSAAEVGAYYKAHKEQFARTDKVRARHIRVTSEACAREVVAEAARGADFAQLARHHSVASDAASGGDLGWVLQTTAPDWLSSLALLQAEQVVSSPFRTPVDTPVDTNQAAAWEILLVEKRVEGHHPLNSETVRYQARKAIAHHKAQTQFASARAQSLRQADININLWLLKELMQPSGQMP